MTRASARLMGSWENQNCNVGASSCQESGLQFDQGIGSGADMLPWVRATESVAPTGGPGVPRG